MRGAARWARLWLALAVLLVAGCSMLVDATDVDKGCPTDQKLCDGMCVAIDDPAYGCGTTSCEPCELKNAIPVCNSSERRCEVEACWLGFACPTEDGCEEYAADNPSCSDQATQR